MRTVCTLALLTLLSLSTVASFGQTKKYDLKSGIITFETETLVMKMKMHDKSVLTFDDYGMKECKETYKDGALDEVTFSDGKTIYLVKPSAKTAYKRGTAYRGTELKFDWNEVSAKDKKEGKAKQLPARTIAGKSCEAFQHVLGSTTSIFAGWKGITLLMETKSDQMTVTTKAVKVEENVAVPAAKFQVPPGYKVQ